MSFKTFVNKLILVFTYGEGLEELLSTKDDEKREAKRLLEKDHLTLCVRHQQESCCGHFAEHNCDYCKLLKSNSILTTGDTNA
jgi:hypothetical protein